MADNLTVKGGPSTPTAEPKAEGKSREDAELDRLRGIAKKHHGRELDDKTLKAIVARRKAKIAKTQKLDETKKEFQTDQSKEQVAAKATDRQTRAQKAMGTKETHGPQKELPAKDGKQVRSNPESGPKLPPTMDKATSPEQAARLLDKMFSFVTVDGKPFNQKAYAETIKERPPTQIAEQKQGKQAASDKQQPGKPQAPAQPGRSPAQPGKQAAPDQQSARQPGAPTTKSTGKTAQGKTAQGKTAQGKPQPGKGALPGKLGESSAALRSGGSGQTSQPQSTAQPGRGPGQMPTTPGAPGRPTVPGGLPAEGTGPALSMSTRGASASLRAATPSPTSLMSSTTVSSDGLFNAGGGLITNSSFDGLNFNWDAFNWFFTMVVMKDLHKYRREMKELRRQEGKAAIAGMRLKHAIKQLRQVYDRNKQLAEVFEKTKDAVGQIKGKIKEGEADAALGDIEHRSVKNDRDRNVLERKRDDLKANKSRLETEMKDLDQDTPEFRTKKNELAETEQQLAEVEGDIAANLARAAELDRERGEVTERRASGGQIGELATLFETARTNRTPQDWRNFREHLQQYRDTIAGLQGHHEVVPYMEQRGAELTEAWRNAIYEREHAVDTATARKTELVAQKEALEGEINAQNREVTAEEEEQLLRIEQQIATQEGIIANPPTQNSPEERHIRQKALLHEAVMLSLTSPSDRVEALDAANKRITQANERIAVLSADPPPEPMLLEDLGIATNDPEAREDLGYWMRQKQDMEDAVPILDWAAYANPNRDPDTAPIPREEINIADLYRDDPDDPGLVQVMAPRAPDQHHQTPEGGRGRQRNGMGIAGDLLRNARQDRGTWGKVGKLTQGMGAILDKVEEGTASAVQATHVAVDRTIDTSINIDMQARHEANAMLRRHASRSQGMVNQLMQVLRMQRSG